MYNVGSVRKAFLQCSISMTFTLCDQKQTLDDLKTFGWLVTVPKIPKTKTNMVSVTLTALFAVVYWIPDKRANMFSAQSKQVCLHWL